MNSSQFKASISALEAILPFTYPADAALSHFFRAHPKIGSQDRHVIAETVFAVLRHLQSLQALNLTGRVSDAKTLLIIWLARQYNLREFEALLNEDERILAKEIKSKKEYPFSLAQKAELPQWVIEILEERGYLAEEILALGSAMQSAAPLDLRVNTLKAKRDDVLASLKESGIEAVATSYSPFGIRLTTKPALQRLPLFLEGKIEVQDEGSQLLGLLVEPSRHTMVVDFCAGAGGKTLLLGALMHSTGRLYALDINDKRLNNLKVRLKRSGLSNVHPLQIQHENDGRISRLAGKIDSVLVDAPCSGFGTLRRNPDLRFRQSEESIDELQQKQISILQSAAKLVKVGGRLVYATCSILPQENQDIVAQFLEENPQFVLQDAAEILKKQRVSISLPSAPYLQLMPNTHQTDGFFAAVLKRSP